MVEGSAGNESSIFDLTLFIYLSFESLVTSFCVKSCFYIQHFGHFYICPELELGYSSYSVPLSIFSSQQGVSNNSSLCLLSWAAFLIKSCWATAILEERFGNQRHAFFFLRCASTQQKHGYDFHIILFLIKWWGFLPSSNSIFPFTGPHWSGGCHRPSPLYVLMYVLG